MTAQPVREFTLVDAMILIAAVAVGFAGIRAEGTDHYHLRPAYALNPLSHRTFVGGGSFGGNVGLPSEQLPPQWLSLVFHWSGIVKQAAPVVAVLSLSLIVIRFRRPRPRFRRLIRQPGLVAGLAMLAVLGINALLGSVQILLAATDQSKMTDPKFYANFSFLACQMLRPGMVGMAVLAAWLVLKVSGRWRREPGWVDSAGLALGWVWVGLLLTEWVVERLR